MPIQPTATAGASGKTVRPVIGVLSAWEMGETLGRYTTNCHYVEQLLDAGAVPIQLPLAGAADDAVLAAWVSLCDGLLLPGGGDLVPALYGQAPLPGFEPQPAPAEAAGQEIELALIRRFAAAGKPILGICLGAQAINAAFGGGLVQDIPTVVGKKLCHNQERTARARVTHTVEVLRGSLLESILAPALPAEGAAAPLTAWVNTYHHQACDAPAPGFTASAHAPDGVIEAVESAQKRILGVQWHPENLADAGRAEAKALFRWLVNAARAQEKA